MSEELYAQSPFSLPPGPERRALMKAQGMNTSPDDWSDEENAELDEQMAPVRAALAALDADAARRDTQA